MLFPTSSSHPTPTRVESAAKSPALFLLQDPDRYLALGQPRAEGPGLPAFTTVVKPRPSGQYMALLSEAARLGPRQALIPKSPPPNPPRPSGPPQAPPLLLRGRDGSRLSREPSGTQGLQPMFTS